MPKAEHLNDGIRANILDDLQRDKPTLEEWSDWVKAKAHRYKCETRHVREFVKQYQAELSVAVKGFTPHYARNIANAFGLSTTKAMKRLDQAMDATKKHIRCNRQGEVTAEIELPDWGARLDAIEKVFKLRGGYPPQQIQVEHSLSDELMEVQRGNLELRAAEIWKDLKQIPSVAEHLKQLEAKEAVGEETVIEAEFVETASSGTPGDPGGTAGEARA
jgi:hypothetical protein